jgi:hypothetical protein
MMQPNQAANELTEDQVLNFLVNTLDEEIDIELGENADIDSEDIWDVLVGASQGLLPRSRILRYVLSDAAGRAQLRLFDADHQMGATRFSGKVTDNLFPAISVHYSRSLVKAQKLPWSL